MASGGTNMSQLSIEESNFLRFYYLNLKVASKAVRIYFDFVHPPSGLAGELGKASTSVTLNGLRFITKLQLQTLYPSTGSHVRSEDFDTTLIVCLLRNMTPRECPPITGWDNIPQPGDTSTGADLARVKWYRNKLAHSEVGKLSPADFTQYWGDLEGAIERLGGKTLQKEAQSAQHIVLDKSLTEMLNMVRVCEHTVAEHAEKISNLQVDIDNQKNIKMEHENKIKRLHDSLQQGEGEALKLAYELSDHKETIDKCQEEIEACSKEIEKMGHIMEGIQANALDRQNQIEKLTKHLVGLDCKHDKKIKEFDDQIALQGEDMAKHDVQLANHDGQMAKHDEQITIHGEQLAKHDEQITIHGEQFAKHDGQFAKHDEHITIHGEQLAKLDGQFAEQGEKIAVYDDQLANHDEQIMEQGEQMAKHDAQIATCVKDIDIMKRKQHDTGVASVGEKQERLEDDTKALIEGDLKEDTFVMTKAVKYGLLLLKQNGVLLITGHAGTGKSRISRHILQIVCSENNSYKYLKLNTLAEWGTIICREEHSIILLDDIFGETNCIYNREKDIPILDKIYAYVCKGNIKVIITIRDTVKRQCQEVFEKHRLFKFEFIDLSSDNYTLDYFEKKGILVKYMKTVRQSNYIEKHGFFVNSKGVIMLDWNEVSGIIMGNPVEGFPLAIYQFVHNETYFQLGCKFFDRPTEAILDDINHIRCKGEDERKFMIWYAILVYIAINENSINLDDSSNVSEVKKMIDAIYGQTINLKRYHILDAVKELKGSYLVIIKNNQIYKIHHQRLLESVILSFAQIDEENINKIIPLLSCSFFLNMIKPVSYQEKEGEVVLKISTYSYEPLAYRLVDIYMAYVSDNKVVYDFVKALYDTEIFQEDGLLLLPYLLEAFEKEDYKDKYTENMSKSGRSNQLAVHLKSKQCFLTTLLSTSVDKRETTFEMFNFILQELKQILKTSNDFCTLDNIKAELISSLYDTCSNKDVQFVKATLDMVEETKIPVLLDQGISLSRIGFSSFGLFEDHDTCDRCDTTYIFLTFCIWKAYEAFNEPVLEYLLSKYNEIQFEVCLFLEMIYTKDWIGTESSLSYKPLEWMVNRFVDQNVVSSDFIIKTACQCNLWDTVVYLASSCRTFDAYSSLELLLDKDGAYRFPEASDFCRKKDLFNFLLPKIDIALTDLTPIVISILKKTHVPDNVFDAILPECLNKTNILILACKNAHFYVANLIMEKSTIIDIQSALIAACMQVEKNGFWRMTRSEKSNVEINKLKIVKYIFQKFVFEQFDLNHACQEAYHSGYFNIMSWFVKNIDITILDLEIIIESALVGGKVEILEYIMDEHKIVNLDKMGVLKYITKYYTARYYVVILKTVSAIWKSAKCKSELKMEEIVKMAYEGKCFELLVWIHRNCKLQISFNAKRLFRLACQECRIDVAKWVIHTFEQISLKIDEGNLFTIACDKIYEMQEITTQIIGIIDRTRDVTLMNPSDLKTGVLKLISHEGVVTWKKKNDFMDFKMSLVIDILGNNLIYLSTDDIEEIMYKSLEQKYYDLVNWLLENKGSSSFDKQKILNKALTDGEIKTIKILKKEFHCLDIHEAIIHACTLQSITDCQYIHDKLLMYIPYNDDQKIACLDLFFKEINHVSIDIGSIVTKICKVDDISDNLMTWILLNLPHEQMPINDVLIACCRLTKLNHVKYVLHTVNNKQFDITEAFEWAYQMLDDWEVDVQLGLCVVDCLFQNFRDKICSLFSDLNNLIKSRTCHVVLFFLEKGHCGNTDMKNLLKGACNNGHVKVVQWILSHVDHKELDVQSTLIHTCWNLHTRNQVKSLALMWHYLDVTSINWLELYYQFKARWRTFFLGMVMHHNKHEDLVKWLSHILDDIHQRVLGLPVGSMFNSEGGEIND
ncbi:Hypothetical predicted protein [Mytilus galloprovincialis]|uniref:DZIP3-like HEPN domain-containing protein n=1 Tax=Mytilus galloprovincialis TaxID=29158 RepID=A0A8B6FLP6_MYTGA|nr:Hypothetical predicted protein [Mytilus galloprovincialis]